MKKKRNLKQELWYLCYMEFMNAILFIFLYFCYTRILEIKFHIVTLYPLLLISLILIEGSIYWFICLSRTKKKDKNLYRTSVAPIYNFLNIFNIVLFVIYIPVFIVNINQTGIIGELIGLSLYLFALIEQINYFCYRLSYYTKNGLGLKVVDPAVKFFTGKASRSLIYKEIHTYKNNTKDMKNNT
ncbi:hypothetical protein [Metaclostridioides mangenotii]|uniref:hypothetical protein n=1 Tax=Metaclostridioides mangenotii TaxID=1540 RepID=UPI00068AC3BB|nr:hypothetical protein [Clostridioides mangenotii]